MIYVTTLRFYFDTNVINMINDGKTKNNIMDFILQMN